MKLLGILDDSKLACELAELAEELNWMEVTLRVPEEIGTDFDFHMYDCILIQDRYRYGNVGKILEQMTEKEQILPNLRERNIIVLVS